MTRTSGGTSVTGPTLAGVVGGCDVVEVSRIADVLDRRVRARAVLVSEQEQADAVRDGVAADAPVALRRDAIDPGVRSLDGRR